MATKCNEVRKREPNNCVDYPMREGLAIVVGIGVNYPTEWSLESAK